jgi:hypothetical protein
MDFADEADIDGCPVRNLFWATDAQIEMPAAFFGTLMTRMERI